MMSGLTGSLERNAQHHSVVRAQAGENPGYASYAGVNVHLQKVCTIANDHWVVSACFRVHCDSTVGIEQLSVAHLVPNVKRGDRHGHRGIQERCRFVSAVLSDKRNLKRALVSERLTRRGVVRFTALLGRFGRAPLNTLE